MIPLGGIEVSVNSFLRSREPAFMIGGVLKVSPVLMREICEASPERLREIFENLEVLDLGDISFCTHWPLEFREPLI